MEAHRCDLEWTVLECLRIQHVNRWAHDSRAIICNSIQQRLEPAVGAFNMRIQECEHTSLMERQVLKNWMLRIDWDIWIYRGMLCTQQTSPNQTEPYFRTNESYLHRQQFDEFFQNVSIIFDVADIVDQNDFFEQGPRRLPNNTVNGAQKGWQGLVVENDYDTRVR